jgi:RNA polymerase sigma-70 factor (ECF subfamily)
VSDRADAQVCIRIVETEFDYVYRTLRRLGASPSDAEDLTQEVFLVMWRRRRDWDPERSLRPWLWGVAYRVSRDHYRRVNRERPSGLLDVADDQLRGEERIAAARARSMVLEAIASLPEKQRAVLVLHELDGVPVREVATRLELPLFTAYTRLRTARKSFARAVRRLQLRAPSAGLVTAEALLAAERPVPPAPAGARQRLGARLRALIAGGPDTPPPLPRRPRPWSAAGTTTVIAAVALALFVIARARMPTAATAAASWATRPPATAVQLTSVASAAPGRTPVASLARDLVGYWRFDEGAGSQVARDGSGYGTHCQLHELDPAVSWVPGVMGNAIHIGGRGWLDCPEVGGLAAISRELTVAAWVYMDRLRPDLAAIVSWERGSGQDYEFFLGMSGEDLLLASTVWARLQWPMPSIVGRWVHLAGTRSADGTRRLYLDGVEVAHKGRRPDVLAPGRGALIVGGRAKSAEPRRVRQRLEGTIDELAIYARALAGEEIAALAARAQPPVR